MRNPSGAAPAADGEPAAGSGLEVRWSGKDAARAAAASPAPASLVRMESHCGSSRRNAHTAPPGLLISGDNALALSALHATHAGKLDLVYIDPPFATGSDHDAALQIGAERARSARSRSTPAPRHTAYRDRWRGGAAEYLNMLLERVLRIRPLVAPAGSLFVHVDRRVAHHVRFLLDEVFGADRLINEIIWCYTGPSSPGMRSFANKHDVIFWYANGGKWTFNADAVRLPYNPSTRRNEGRRTGFTTGNPDLVVKLHPGGKFPEDWWVIPVEAPASRVRTAYPTQKPERLLRRVLLAASNPGDLIADVFCGSGTTLAVAQSLGRRWIGCDRSPLAIHTCRKRVLDISDASFDVCRVRGHGAAAEPEEDQGRVDVELEDQGAGRVALRIAHFSPALRSQDDAAGFKSGLRHWSDWIDYWAIDWSCSGVALAPGFVAYRTRRRRQLPLSSPPVPATVTTTARAVVQVIDVLGRETRREVDLPAAPVHG